MNRKEKIAWLSRASEMERRIRICTERIRRQRELAEGAKPQDFTKTIGGHGSTPSSRLEIHTIEAIDLEEKRARMMDEYRAIEAEVSGAIDSLNDIQSEEVLSYRYLSGKDWKDVADTLGISLTYTFHLHSRALDLLRIPDSTAPFVISAAV